MQSTKELEAIVRRFNLTFTVGDSVVLRTDTGEGETMLESPARIYAGTVVADFRAAVPAFEAGTYLIDNRVRHVDRQPAA